MSPTGQWYGRTFTGLKPGSRQLALTYDDGPNDPHTLRLLEVLARHDVHATFFMIGRFVRQRTDIVREVARAGHAIGNHTYNHPNLVFCSRSQTETEIKDCQNALQEAVGQPCSLFRPPFGGRRALSLQIAENQELKTVMWNLTGGDWKGESAEAIEKKISSRLRGGNVILLHDGGHAQFGADRSQTVAATGSLLPRCRAAGYEFVTVPEMMMAVSGHTPSANITAPAS